MITSALHDGRNTTEDCAMAGVGAAGCGLDHEPASDFTRRHG